MTLTAVFLLIVSAIIHAAWNLLGKRANPTTAFFLVANTVGVLCLLPVLFIRRETVALFPARLWLFLALSGLCQAVYYAALAGAYRAGDMSVAYPLARSVPVIIVMFVTLILGRGGQIGPRCLLGIPLVVGGAFLLPMRNFRDFRPGIYLQAACLLALCAACGTAGYSMIDDAALRLLRGTVGGHPPARILDTLLYGFFEALAATAWLAVFVACKKDKQKSNQLPSFGQASLAGVGVYLAYSLVLVAMSHVTNITYIVAFRQLSIPIGAAAAVLLLGEKPYAARIAGVGVMFVGLALVGSG
jgi:drug/metabolite transporter (DMT)-like permease